MTEVDVEIQESEKYSRRNNKRSTEKGELRQVSLNRQFKQKILTVNVGPILFWSALLSLLSVANPFLTSLSSNLQSQSLYAGFAMQIGQQPYGSFFGMDGLLYYLLTSIGSSFGTTLGLVVLQFVSLVGAGIYFYKIMGYFSQSHKATDQLLLWFYIFIMAFSRGGVYASLFALPFVLASLWFLIRYTNQAVRDEGFILFGILGALVFLIDPNSALLWLVTFLVLLVVNIAKKEKARGFYQFLASLFGFLLIVYPIGYYTLVNQILGNAIQQTFLYHLKLDFSYSDFLLKALIFFGLILITGFFKNSIQMLLIFNQGTHRALKVLVLLVFATHLFFIMGQSSIETAQMIWLLPYGFMAAVLSLQDWEQKDDSLTIQKETLHYLKSNFYLPLVAALYVLVAPLVTYMDSGQVLTERSQIATYIRNHSEETDKIYTWDNSAQVYLASQRLSAATIITAEPYLNTKENQQQLLYDLTNNQATYIVVNRNLLLLDGLETTLDSQYEVLDLGLSQFLVYHKK